MRALPLASTDDAVCCPPRPRLRAKATAGYARLLRALGDETRLGIVGLLAGANGDGGGALCVCDIESRFELSQPTISHHLKILRDAGLVTTEKRGTWVYYALDRERLAALGELYQVLAK